MGGVETLFKVPFLISQPYYSSIIPPICLSRNPQADGLKLRRKIPIIVTSNDPYFIGRKISSLPKKGLTNGFLAEER